MRPALVLIAMLAAGCLDGGPAPETLFWPHERYLLGDRVPGLVVEVHAETGWEPSELTLDAVQDQIRLATGRDVVEVADAGRPQTTAGADGVWTMEEFGALMAEVGPQSTPETARMALVFVAGEYEQAGVAGMAGFDTAVVFSEVISSLAEIPVAGTDVRVPNPDFIYHERAAAVHELGHLLGLVNRPVPRHHGPVAADGEHSNDTASVMYPAVHGMALAGLQPEDVPYRFTADDVADLRDFQRSRGLVV